MSSPKMQSALLGALVYAVLSTLLGFILYSGGGMNMAASMVGCLIPIIAAAVAVWHYTSTNSLSIPAGEGAGLGAMAGAAGAVFGSVITLLLQSIGLFPSTEQMVEMQREQMLSQGMEPEQIDQGMQMMEMFSSPLVGILIGIVVGAVLGAIVGAIASLIFKKGEEEDLVI